MGSQWGARQRLGRPQCRTLPPCLFLHVVGPPRGVNPVSWNGCRGVERGCERRKRRGRQRAGVRANTGPADRAHGQVEVRRSGPPVGPPDGPAGLFGPAARISPRRVGGHACTLGRSVRPTTPRSERRGTSPALPLVRSPTVDVALIWTQQQCPCSWPPCRRAGTARGWQHRPPPATRAGRLLAARGAATAARPSQKSATHSRPRSDAAASGASRRGGPVGNIPPPCQDSPCLASISCPPGLGNKRRSPTPQS